MEKIRVGVTIRIDKPTESLFTNGIKQNAITLFRMFQLCKNVSEVYMINMGTQKDLSQSPWFKYNDNIISYEECLDKIDVVVMATVSLSDVMMEIMRNRNIKIVAQVMGTEYHMFSEYTLFEGNELLTDFKRKPKHDAVWISPHIFDSNKDLLEINCDCKAYVAPFIWSHDFIDQEIENYKVSHGINGIYTPTENVGKRISTFEPNINLVKTCITPIISSEKLYRKYPDSFQTVNIFSSDKIANKKVFIDFVQGLEIYKGGKMTFEGRYAIAFALFFHTDIVIAHQKDLELNYLYFDAAWYGFPLVHNSSRLKDLGYYYPEYNAEIASELLMDVIHNFDKNREEYLLNSRKIISKYLWNDKDNVKGYENLLKQVMKTKK